jgi:hypothetical protein
MKHVSACCRHVCCIAACCVCVLPTVCDLCTVLQHVVCVCCLLYVTCVLCYSVLCVSDGAGNQRCGSAGDGATERHLLPGYADLASTHRVEQSQIC